MTSRWRFFKNAVANLGKGGAAAIVALLLPPLLIRHMTPAAYGVWVLVLQAAAYIGYFDFGLQTAIGRYVAYTTEKNDQEHRNLIFSTAFAGLIVAAGLSLLLLAVVVLAVRVIFPAVPSEIVPMMRWSLLILGTSLVLGLPAAAWNGVFVGLQRYEIPALVTGGSRLVAAVGVVVAAVTGYSIIVMATIMAITNLAAYAVQYVAMNRVAPAITFARRFVSKSTAGELLEYCFGLTVMSFSMLLVTGFDLILVGRFEFAAVTAYSVSAAMITFISGVLSAILGVMMPHAAALHARHEPRQLGQLVVTSTQAAIILLVFTGIPAMVYAGPLLRLWIGPQYVQLGRPILVILLAANILRLIGLPYATVLISAGQQHLIKISPITEGVSNLTASIILGMRWGAVGVAYGTLVGSLFSIASHVFYSMPKTNAEIHFSRQEYLLKGVLIPLLCTAPLLLCGLLSMGDREKLTAHLAFFSSCTALSAIGSAILLQRSGVLTFRRASTTPRQAD